MKIPDALVAFGLAVTMALPVGATRFDTFTQRFADNPDQAKVMAAGYLGGAGTEWLVGGGFQPDGTIVLVGTALGPTLETAGTTAVMIGNVPENIPARLSLQLADLRTPGKPAALELTFDGKAVTGGTLDGAALALTNPQLKDNVLDTTLKVTLGADAFVLTLKAAVANGAVTGTYSGTRGAAQITGAVAGRIADTPTLAAVTAPGNARAPLATWTHENATAYILRMSPDMKTVKSLVRFPWKAAGATSATVDAQGAIYLTGAASNTLGNAFPDATASPVDTEKIGDTTVPVRTIYLAKINPAGDTVEWLCTMTGPSNAPTIELDPAGLLRLQGTDVRCFDADGALKQVAVVPGGMTTHNAVNPTDGSFCYAFEHHWPTGREPWRCPVLKIYDKDGKLQHHLYDFGGPFVGLGEMRLVSDTAIRAATYDKDGNLILYLWSDGGNSVALREPMDVYKASPNMKGLGMSSWGAGVLSMAYIVKLDGKTFRVASGTVWAAYLKDRDKPNSIWIDTMGFGADGSTLIGGRSASGLIQTGNNLNPYTKADPTVTPGGTYVSVMSPDLTSLRFSSVMPNCGVADVGNGNVWAFRTGTVNGKPLALVLSGASGKNANGYSAPIVAGAQPEFGGGLTDGHILILDLSKAQ